MRRRRALVVHGGWPGHEPARAARSVVPLLRERGFRVELSDDLDSYTRADLPTFDLIVQCWTMGRITDEQINGLLAAVRGGTGFAGWHGGIADSFRSRAEYLQLVGAQFVAHPGDITVHQIDLTDLAHHTEPDVVTGVTWPLVLDTEQYWVLSDDYNDVLATTTLPVRPDSPWHRPVTCPAVWTRRWGEGRVFVCTVGHSPDDLAHPGVRTVLDRGMAWAAR